MPKEIPIACKSRIWCGTWHGRKRHLGWCMPQYISPNGNTALDTEQRKMLSEGQQSYFPGDLFRCEIVIRPLKNRRGNFIVRRNERRDGR